MHLLSEYVKMEEERRRYMELCARLFPELDTMVKVAKALKLPWEGEANRQFLTRLAADHALILQTFQKLETAGELLQEILTRYQKTEGVIGEIIEEIKC